MNKIKNSLKGFSVVEILLTLTITLIIVGLYTVTFIKKEQLNPIEEQLNCISGGRFIDIHNPDDTLQNATDGGMQSYQDRLRIYGEAGMHRGDGTGVFYARRDGGNFNNPKSYTLPTGINEIYVTMTAGGGGGGAHFYSYNSGKYGNAYSKSDAGPGGGGGAYMVKTKININNPNNPNNPNTPIIVRYYLGDGGRGGEPEEAAIRNTAFKQHKIPEKDAETIGTNLTAGGNGGDSSIWFEDVDGNQLNFSIDEQGPYQQILLGGGFGAPAITFSNEGYLRNINYIRGREANTRKNAAYPDISIKPPLGFETQKIVLNYRLASSNVGEYSVCQNFNCNAPVKPALPSLYDGERGKGATSYSYGYGGASGFGVGSYGSGGSGGVDVFEKSFAVKDLMIINGRSGGYKACGEKGVGSILIIEYNTRCIL